MMKMISPFALVAIAGLSLSLTSCGESEATTDPEVKPDVTPPPAAAPTSLLYGRGKDSLTLDPAAAQDGESTKVIDNIFETLVDFDDDPENPSRIVPVLATSWTESEDRLTWTFALREGVQFHDGQLFDSLAAKLSLDRLVIRGHPKAPKSRPYGGNFEGITRIEAVSPFELIIHLERPSSVLLRNLAMFCASMVSPASVGRGMGERPIGTGPYAFKLWKQGSKVIVLERNEEWWQEPKPQIETLVFREIRDWHGRMAQLASGEIHMTDDVVFSDIEKLRETPGVSVQVRTGMNCCYVTLNNERAPFDDARVRKAAAMAVDRKRIVELGYYGFGKAARDIIPSTIPYHSNDVAPARDPAGAKRLLAEVLAEGTERKDKLSVDLWVMNNPRPYLQQPDRVAEILRDSLNAVGFEVRIVKYDWSAYLQKLQQGEHQMALIGWSTDNGDPDNFYGPLLSEALIGGTNYSRMRNKAFEEALALSKAESNPAKRRALFVRMQAALREECPSIPLVYTPIASAYRKDVEGFIRHPIKIKLAKTRRVATR